MQALAPANNNNCFHFFKKIFITLKSRVDVLSSRTQLASFQGHAYARPDLVGIVFGDDHGKQSFYLPSVHIRLPIIHVYIQAYFHGYLDMHASIHAYIQNQVRGKVWRQPYAQPDVVWCGVMCDAMWLECDTTRSHAIWHVMPFRT